MKKYKVGYVAGFFDILHEGHVEILEYAKSQCEELIVAVGTDEFMQTRKKRAPILKYDQRVKILSAIKYVDRIVPETNLNKIEEYKKYQFDVMFSGDDHEYENTYVEAAKILKDIYDVDTVYVKRSDVSSTAIRERVCAERDNMRC